MPQPTQDPVITQLDEATAYHLRMKAALASNQYKGYTQDQRREMIGNMIYELIERQIGEEKAPKVCGMILDLNQTQLHSAIISMDNLKQRVNDAMQLLNN